MPAFNDEDHAGEFNPGAMTIHILKGMGRDQTEDTLLHEIIHAISSICMKSTKELTEVQVDLLATQLRDTLTRNPELHR